MVTNPEMLDWLFSRLANYLNGAGLRRQMQSEAQAIEEVLMALGYVTRRAATAKRALAALEEFGAQVALVDIRLGDTDGVKLMDHVVVGPSPQRRNRT